MGSHCFYVILSYPCQNILSIFNYFVEEDILNFLAIEEFNFVQVAS